MRHTGRENYTTTLVKHFADTTCLTLPCRPLQRDKSCLDLRRLHHSHILVKKNVSKCFKWPLLTKWETLTVNTLLIPGAQFIRIDSIGVTLAACLQTFAFLAFLHYNVDILRSAKLVVFTCLLGQKSFAFGRLSSQSQPKNTIYLMQNILEYYGGSHLAVYIYTVCKTDWTDKMNLGWVRWDRNHNL